MDIASDATRNWEAYPRTQLITRRIGHLDLRGTVFVPSSLIGGYPPACYTPAVCARNAWIGADVAPSAFPDHGVREPAIRGIRNSADAKRRKQSQVPPSGRTSQVVGLNPNASLRRAIPRVTGHTGHGTRGGVRNRSPDRDDLRRGTSDLAERNSENRDWLRNRSRSRTTSRAADGP